MNYVVAPTETPATVTDHIAGITLGEPPRWWFPAFAFAVLLLMGGALGIAWLFLHGIQVWGNNWPEMWGFPIINYVWWIGIASGGTIISALFYLTGSKWRTSINRTAEGVTIFAASCAGVFPIIHLGRPWFFYWLFPYPNTMTLWPQFRSPLLWDFIAVLAYVISSVLFWFLGLIPDVATLRDRAKTRPAQLFYGILALGFRGTGPQWRHYHRAYGTMAAIMAPHGRLRAQRRRPRLRRRRRPRLVLHPIPALLRLRRRPLRLRHRADAARCRCAACSASTPTSPTAISTCWASSLLLCSLCLAYCYAMDVFDAYYSDDKAAQVMFNARLWGRIRAGSSG